MGGHSLGPTTEIHQDLKLYLYDSISICLRGHAEAQLPLRSTVVELDTSDFGLISDSEYVMFPPRPLGPTFHNFVYFHHRHLHPKTDTRLF
jgi:hypothetical protein